MSNIIEQLQTHVVQVQRQLVAQRQRLMQQERSSQVAFDKLCLGIIDVLDLTEQLTRISSDDSVNSDVPKAIAKVNRRLATLLKRQGIEECRLSGNMPEAGKCRVVGTQNDSDKQPGEIVEILRRGYCSGQRVLRPIEVMTQSASKG